ncbi:hypothetical protein, partial [Pseudomonas fluorescens]|uniref:hypothetical protein n=1 Tax=Pseudomonas fluorescens TaxID=294 RepID=UPI001242F6E9
MTKNRIAVLTLAGLLSACSIQVMAADTTTGTEMSPSGTTVQPDAATRADEATTDGGPTPGGAKAGGVDKQGGSSSSGNGGSSG